MKRVLIITYYWPPAGGPGVQRWLKFTKYLPAFGVQPIVVTVDPERAEYPVRDASLCGDVMPEVEVHPTDCFGLYDIYKRFTRSKQAPFSGFVNEANPTFKQKVARFVRGNFFLPDARRGWNRYAYRKAAELIEKYSIRTVITTGPPMSTHLVGLKLKKRFSVKWIADFRDPWTDIYYYNEMYPTRVAKWIDRRYERQVLEQSDVVFSANFIQEKLARKSSNIDPRKIHILTNGYDEEDFSIERKKKERFTITYAGTLASSYPLQTFIEAVAELAREHELRVQFVGKVSEDHRRLIENYPEIQAVFPGFVTHERAVRELQESHLLLLVFHDTERNEGHMPGKIFEYLAARTPILCLEDQATMAGQIITSCGCGETCSFHDKEKMKACIMHYFASPVFEGDEEKIAAYSRRRLTEHLIQYID